MYRIKIQNEFGSDTELVDLVVLGPPGKPMGPLQVKDVLANSCKLVWKPPEDDGGCPIKDYDIEMLCPKTKQWKKVCYFFGCISFYFLIAGVCIASFEFLIFMISIDW